MKEWSNSPFNYQGGKSNIAEWVISHFPANHRDLHYVEPFAGSLAVLFKKPRAQVESVSDTNKNIYYFFKVLRDDYDALMHKLTNTINCENTVKECRDIYNGKKKVDNITRAWATYCYFRMSFGGSGSSFGYQLDTPDRGCNYAFRFHTCRKRLHIFRERMKCVQVFNRPAQWFIDKFQKYNKTLMYLDPPYPETAQRAYKDKFDMDDFNKMLASLHTAKFKFALSFYEKDGMELEKFRESEQYSFLYKNTRSTTGLRNDLKRTECLLINYKSSHNQAEFKI